jgi:hypothetical protein
MPGDLITRRLRRYASAEVNLGIFPLRKGLDPRIFLLQPLAAPELRLALRHGAMTSGR